ncbi:MAG: DarT ssDNA thymidine ADP-ribosyltransferase family protein [Candidatus Poribacteria bacterium]|nr:DarT ssDNA thymidine ADP-ribosyltransferase family protein [Candidatus Poribacteria bacterium]
MNFNSLFYITHIENLQSIIKQGIPSYKGIPSYRSIKSEDGEFISLFKGKTNLKNDIDKRSKIIPQFSKTNILSYVSLFFQPRNPILYRAIFETGLDKLVILEVAKTVLNEPGVIISDGNVTEELTQFYPCSQGLKKIQQAKIIHSDWWKKCDGSKRRIMAECLIPERVKPEYIRSVIIADDITNILGQMMLRSSKLPVNCNPEIFFQPKRRISIGKNITLIDGGDMFFSQLQTLTITVNLQGIMGKGLALRTREQFPDVYVEYEKACRTKRITTDRPYIYKREESVADELTDIKPYRKNIENPYKWFLLFATKRHWKTNSRIEDIENGLKWVQEYSTKEGIQSLAMSALGCALGGLNWKDVAPLMCKYLDEIGIPIEIYLPREYSIDPVYLTQSYLLSP